MKGTLPASILTAVALAATPVLACEQLYLPPSDMEAGVELVTGVVRGHVAKEPLAGSSRATPGVTVEILEAGAAISPGEHIDVYPLAVGPDCATTPREMADVREQYAVGDRVVFAWQPGDTAPSIDIESNRFGYLAKSPESVARDENGCLDFNRFRESYEPNRPFSAGVGWRNAHRRWFEDFELLRCYRLLENVEDPAKRLSSLANLGFYHWWYEAGNAKLASQSYRQMLKTQHVAGHERRQLSKRFRASREGAI